MKERTSSILNRLLSSEVPLTIKYIANEYSVSERTIRNEINIINDELVSLNLPQIKTIRNKGIFLSLDKKQKNILNSKYDSTDEFQYLTPDERLIDIILDIAFGNQPVFLNKKEEEYKVSKSTLDDDIRNVRKYLSEFNLEVVSVPKIGLQFNSDENKIRSMLFFMLSSIYFDIDDAKKDRMFKYVPKNDLEILDKVNNKYFFDRIGTHYPAHFNLLTYIWMRRIKQGNLIRFDSNEDRNNKTIDENILPYVSEIINLFSIETTEDEFFYITMLLKSLNKEDDYYPSNWLDIQLLIVRMIQYVEYNTSILFTKYEFNLQKSLYSHISSMVKRIQSGLQLVNPLKDKIKHSYSVIFTTIKDFMLKVENELGGRITDDEIAFITIHFSTALSELNQNKQYWYRAVVVCNYGIATGKLLAENLKENFNIEILAVVSSHDITLLEKFDADLVFSTIHFEYTKKPLLVIDSIFNSETKLLVNTFLEQNSSLKRTVNYENDYTEMFQEILELYKRSESGMSAHLYKEIEQIFYKNKLLINKRKVQPMIQDLLPDENISVERGEYTWEEAIRKVSEPLLKSDVITEEYVNAMIKGVNDFGPYIVIGPHLALAHARPEDGTKKLGLSVSVFEKSIKFNHEFNDPVKIIFCLSAVDSYSHLNVMKSLVNLIREENKLTKLYNAKNKNEIKEILFNE
nr:BglG family transcription antiterminator [Globicatella sanguinis]